MLTLTVRGIEQGLALLVGIRHSVGYISQTLQAVWLLGELRQALEPIATVGHLASVTEVRRTV